MRPAALLVCLAVLVAGCSGLPLGASDDARCAPEVDGGEPEGRYPERPDVIDPGTAADYAPDFEAAFVYNTERRGADSVSVHVRRVAVLEESDDGVVVRVETVANYRDGDAYVEAPHAAVYRVDETATVRAETETELANGSGTPYRVCD